MLKYIKFTRRIRVCEDLNASEALEWQVFIPSATSVLEGYEDAFNSSLSGAGGSMIESITTGANCGLGGMKFW